MSNLTLIFLAIIFGCSYFTIFFNLLTSRLINAEKSFNDMTLAEDIYLRLISRRNEAANLGGKIIKAREELFTAYKTYTDLLTKYNKSLEGFPMLAAFIFRFKPVKFKELSLGSSRKKRLVPRYLGRRLHNQGNRKVLPRKRRIL